MIMSQKKRMQLFLVGFILGSVPTFCIMLLYSEPLSDSSVLAAVLGAVFGIVSALGGKKIVQMLAALIESSCT